MGLTTSYKNVVRVPFFYDTEKTTLSYRAKNNAIQRDRVGLWIYAGKSKVKFLPSLDYLYSLLRIDIACNVSEFIALLPTFS